MLRAKLTSRLEKVEFKPSVAAEASQRRAECTCHNLSCNTFVHAPRYDNVSPLAVLSTAARKRLLMNTELRNQHYPIKLQNITLSKVLCEQSMPLKPRLVVL